MLPGVQARADFTPQAAGPGQGGYREGPADGFAPGRQPRSAQHLAASPGRHRALLIGASVLAVVAVAGVFAAPQLFGGPSDPGCKAYADTALSAYNKAIADLNAQAPQATVNADMTTAITQLTTAAGQAQSAQAKSALNGLLTELKKVSANVTQGSVPASIVKGLNAASTAADNAC